MGHNDRNPDCMCEGCVKDRRIEYLRDYRHDQERAVGEFTDTMDLVADLARLQLGLDPWEPEDLAKVRQKLVELMYHQGCAADERLSIESMGLMAQLTIDRYGHDVAIANLLQVIKDTAEVMFAWLYGLDYPGEG